MPSSDFYSTAHLDQSCVDLSETSGQPQQIDHIGLWDLSLDNNNQPFQDATHLEIRTSEWSPIVIFDNCKKPPP
jgi:hypothetical protein